jgi:hypothetical protein
MAEHKFRIGQMVIYARRVLGREEPPAEFEVLRLLPSDGAENQYRIKSTVEAFEHVVRESQLSRPPSRG